MAKQTSDPLALQVSDIDGNTVNLEKYRNKVVLFVNLASECGYTRQYPDLEKLWQRYQGQGLVVLGFPSNDFGEQEPGSNAEVKRFATEKFGVTFPLFAKSPVKGAQANPVYQALSAQSEAPKWNFHKYLLRPNGTVSAFSSGVEPLSPELVAEIEAALEPEAKS